VNRGGCESLSRVNAFVAEHFSSLDDLQVFVLVAGDSAQWWAADVVAERLRVSVAAVRRSLDRFVSQNLFDVRAIDHLRYRYEPGSPALRDDADAFLEEFRRAPSHVMKQITFC
jgi:hypothetical protein